MYPHGTNDFPPKRFRSSHIETLRGIHTENFKETLRTGPGAKRRVKVNENQSRCPGIPYCLTPMFVRKKSSPSKLIARIYLTGQNVLSSTGLSLLSKFLKPQRTPFEDSSHSSDSFRVNFSLMLPTFLQTFERQGPALFPLICTIIDSFSNIEKKFS